MKLEGGERLVLKMLLDLQGDSGEYVEDSRWLPPPRWWFRM